MTDDAPSTDIDESSANDSQPAPDQPEETADADEPTHPETAKKASNLSGVPTNDGLEPIIPPDRWDEFNIIDDVTGNPEVTAPNYIIEAVIEHHGSREAAGLVEGHSVSESSADSPGPESGEASTAGVGVGADLPDISLQPDDPLGDGPDESPQDEHLAKFDAKEPDTLSFWRSLWNDLGLELEQPLSDAQLVGALQRGKGLRQDQTEPAIRVGVASGVLVADEHEDTVYFGPAMPSRAPGRYLESPRRFGDQSGWEDVWRVLDVPLSDGIEADALPRIVYDELDVSKPEAVAAVAAARELDVLVLGTNGKYYLGDKRYPSRWLAVWEGTNRDPETDGVRRQVLVREMKWVYDDIDRATRQEWIDTALERGTLYERDGKLYLNDPLSDEGPPIDGGFPDDPPADEAAGRQAHPAATESGAAPADGEQQAEPSDAGTHTASSAAEQSDAAAAESDGAQAGSDTPTMNKSMAEVVNDDDPAETDADTADTDADSANADPTDTADADADTADAATETADAAAGDTDAPSAGEDAPADDHADVPDSGSESSPESSSGAADAETDGNPNSKSTATDDASSTPDAETATPSESDAAPAPENQAANSAAEQAADEPAANGHAPPEDDPATDHSRQSPGAASTDEPTAQTVDQESAASPPQQGESPATQDSESDTATATDDSPQSSSSSRPDHATIQVAESEPAPTPDDPPEDAVTLPDHVQAAFSDGVAFFHAMLDVPLNAVDAAKQCPGDSPLLEGLQAKAQARADVDLDQLGSPWPADPPGERVRWPATAREYFQQPAHDPPDLGATDVTVDDLRDPDVDVTADDLMPADAGPDPDSPRMLPEGFETRYSRRWSADIIEDKQLGFAPSPDHYDLVRYLFANGHDRETIIRTGLAESTVDDDASPDDYPAPTPDEYDHWQDCPVDHEELDLSIKFEGRFVFPYFNRYGNPVYVISRRVGDGHVADEMDQAKYTKLKKNDSNDAEEPIYGIPTIREGEGLVITEGIADAITAHQYGIPCISPVTTSFKTDDRAALVDLLTDYDIPAVYLIQDADPVSANLRGTSREGNLPADAQRRLGLEYWVRAADEDLPVGAKVSTPDDTGLDDSLSRESLTPDAIPTDDLPDVLPWDVPYRADPADEPGRLHDSPTPKVDEAVKTAIQSDTDDGEADSDDGDGEEWSAFERAREESDAVTPSHARGPIGAALSIDEFGPGIRGAVTTACDLYFTLNDAVSPPPTATHPEQTDSVTIIPTVADETTTPSPTTDSSEAADESDESDESETVDPSVDIAPAQTPVPLSAPAGEETQHEETSVHIIELPQFGGEKTDLDDYLQDDWLPYCQIADWNSRLTTQVNSPDPSKRWKWLLELTQDHELLQFDPRNAANTSTMVSDELPSPHAILGQLPSISPPYLHPGYFEYELKSAMESTRRARMRAELAAKGDDSFDPDDEGDDWGHELFSLTFHDLGIPLSHRNYGSYLYRGKNPIAHLGDSEDYFVVSRPQFAYDFKRKAGYNPILWLLIKADVRDLERPSGELSDAEQYAAWKYAKKEGYISEETPPPRPALTWLAKEHGFVEEEAIEVSEYERDGEPIEVEYLPDEAFEKTLTFIEEEEGVNPGWGSGSSSADPSDVSTGLPASKFENHAVETADEPIVVFFDQYITKADEPEKEMVIAKGTLKILYREWAAINDVEVKNDTWFGRDLNRYLPFDKDDAERRPRIGDDLRPRCYMGVELSASGQQLRKFVEAKRGFTLITGQESSPPADPDVCRISSIAEYESEYF